MKNKASGAPLLQGKYCSGTERQCSMPHTTYIEMFPKSLISKPIYVISKSIIDSTLSSKCY